MNLYEKIMILDPGLDEERVEEAVQRVRDIITRGGGEVLKTENWGIRKLAYELNKREKGYYILLLFKSPPSLIPELERHARVTEQIVKIMIIKIHKKRHIEAVMASLETEKTAGEGTIQQDTTSPETTGGGGEDVQ
jgi:small subunit ribosomal protein S6